jgi:hypothetical protein
MSGFQRRGMGDVMSVDLSQSPFANPSIPFTLPAAAQQIQNLITYPTNVTAAYLDSIGIDPFTLDSYPGPLALPNSGSSGSGSGSPASTPTNYTPWIIGGVIALFGLMAFNGGRK